MLIGPGRVHQFNELGKVLLLRQIRSNVGTVGFFMSSQ